MRSHFSHAIATAAFSSFLLLTASTAHADTTPTPVTPPVDLEITYDFTLAPGVTQGVRIIGTNGLSMNESTCRAVAADVMRVSDDVEFGTLGSENYCTWTNRPSLKFAQTHLTTTDSDFSFTSDTPQLIKDLESANRKRNTQMRITKVTVVFPSNFHASSANDNGKIDAAGRSVTWTDTSAFTTENQSANGSIGDPNTPSASPTSPSSSSKWILFDVLAAVAIGTVICFVIFRSRKKAHLHAHGTHEMATAAVPTDLRVPPTQAGSSCNHELRLPHTHQLPLDEQQLQQTDEPRMPEQE